MRGFPDLGGDGAGSDPEGAFVPEHLPEPGPFLGGHDLLRGEDHVACHRIARECFEERGVYDMTFGYNLARLNRDRRHPDAGFRYAIETSGSDAREAVETDGAEPAGAEPDGPEIAGRALPDGPGGRPPVLRAEFTPTTPFCPQSDTLAVGSFRAWNGLADRHEYDLVRVRVAPMHHASDAINATLERLETRFVETGSLEATAEPGDRPEVGTDGVDGSDPTDDPFR